MATQRLTVATLAGQSAIAVATRFDRWRAAADPAAVDQLCASIREHSLALSVVYFTEWVDRWLMGNLVPGPKKVEGHRVQATCLSPTEAVAWADQCGDQFAEHGWLVSRLREAAGGWGGVGEPYAVVIVREVVWASVTDGEVQAAAASVPSWLV